MDITLIIKFLNTQNALIKCVIGAQRFYTDKMAMLVDFGQLSSLLDHLPMLEEAVIISPKRALIITNASQQAWKDIITTQTQTNVKAAIETFKSRRNFNGGQTWARAELLDCNIRKARAINAFDNQPAAA